MYWRIINIIKDSKIYAYYEPNKYTIYFNANGGNTPNPTSKTVTYDSTYGSLASISRIGYTFNGWYTASSGGSKIDTSTKVNITSNQTLYAHWTVNSYIVSISAGTGGSVSKTSMSINYGGTNTFTATPSSGYYLESISCTNGYSTSGYSTTMSSTNTQNVVVNNNYNANNSNCIISFKPVTIYENGSCNLSGCNTNTASWSFSGSSCWDEDKGEWRTEIKKVEKGPEFSINVTNINYIFVDYTITSAGTIDAYTYTSITATAGSISTSSSVTIECVKSDKDDDSHQCDSNTTTKRGTLTLDVKNLTGYVSFSIKYENDTNGFNHNYCYNNSGNASVLKIYTS